MMSEDLAGQSMTMAQKSAEIAVELARLLKSIYDSHTQKKRSLGQGQTAVKEPNIKSGEVDLSRLKKSGGSISMQTNISARDMEVIAAKAKDYDIPVSFIGKGENAENVTLAFRTNDKAAIDQILKEVMTEKLAVKPDDYLMFEMNNLGEAQTMEAMLKENDIPADITKGANGKYQCIYEAKHAEALKIIKADFQEVHNEISKNFTITFDEETQKYNLSDNPIAYANEELKSVTSKISDLNDPSKRSSFYTEISEDPNIDFPTYSEKNMEIVHEKMPDAVRVAGKAFWEKQGYEVNDDAKGIEIVAPQMDDEGNLVLDGNGKQVFTTTTVYDVSETNAFEKTVGDKIEALQQKKQSLEQALKNSEENVTANKTLTLSSLPTKEKFMKICREQFGYSEAKAIEAANKFENTLSGEKLEYFRTDTRQAALLNNFERNIHLKDDSLLVKPYSFTRANFSSDNVNRYLVTNGEKAAALIPDKMSREEMADTVRNKLGVNDPETVKAIVDKAEKIEVANKVAEIKKEAEIAKHNGDIAIERRSEKFFEASQGAVKRSYDLTDKKNSVKALQKDFGISSKKAESIFQKAQNQSTLQNDFHKMAEKSKANAKPIKDKKTNKGARK